MEYIDGRAIDAILEDQGVIPWQVALEYGIQICRGLKHAHDLGVVHRDMKPANVLIDQRGNFKIADYGIARTWGNAALTSTGAIIGTPEFMSPEQAEGQIATPASDIYSFGAVFYSMITGRPPFRHTSN